MVLRPDRAGPKDRTRAYRQKPKARSFAPAPIAADPRYLDVFVPLGVRKTLPVETEPRANFYVSDTWTSQTVVSVYALQSQKPAIPGTQVSKSAAPATLGGDSDPFANLATELDFAERQSIAIQEFRHLVGGSQGFLLGAALIDGLRPQRLNALNDPREIFIAGFGAGACRR